MARRSDAEGRLLTDDAPLILTLRLDEAAMARFEAERAAYFPAARNLVPAHLTLFHHLPGLHALELGSVLAEPEAAFTATVSGMRNLGRGVAYTLDGEALLALRARLARRWQSWLTAQDQQRFAPHVTIQNKVAPAEARALQGRLSAGFTPFVVTAMALELWRYRGGPWEAAARYALV